MSLEERYEMLVNRIDDLDNFTIAIYKNYPEIYFPYSHAIKRYRDHLTNRCISIKREIKEEQAQDWTW